MPPSPAIVRARAAWAALAEEARVYAADLSVSDKISARGHWIDRLAAIDEDIARMAARAEPATAGATDVSRVRVAVAHALGTAARLPAPCTHTPPSGFTPRTAVPLELRITSGSGAATVRCHYRHVNQAERFVTVPMEKEGAVHRASIPAAYTDSPYPLQYYFTLAAEGSAASIYPGLGPERMNLPYFVLRRLPA